MKSHRRSDTSHLPADPARSSTDPGQLDGAGPSPSAGGIPHQATLEQAFGADLSALRATVGGGAGADLQALGKAASTDGLDLSFAETPTLALAAHELAHAMLGHSGGDDDAEEAEADRVAQQVVAGEQVDLGEKVRGTSGVAFYSEAGDLQISGNQGMATNRADPQELWATHERITEANAALAVSGSLGSFVELVETTESLQSLPQTLYKVRVQWVSRVPGFHHTLDEMNNDPTQTPQLYKECGKAASLVMGATSENDSAGVCASGDGSRTSIPGLHDGGVEGEPKSHPQQLANAIYFERIGPFIQDPGNAEHLVRGTHYTKGLLGGKSFIKPRDSEQARQMYLALGPQGMDAFDAFVGINRYADPAIGEAYTMATGGAPIAGASTWTYHWAAVIMKDGGDNVVLESYAGQREVGDDWNFQMLGTASADQTFHEQHEATGQHGDQPTTVVAKA